MKHLAALLSGFTLCTCAQASDRLGSPLEDYFRLTAGIFSATTTTDARIDASDATLGTPLSGEEDFGLRDRSELADVEAELRPRKRHKLRFNYFQLKRRGNALLTRDIAFGDELYQIDDVVESRLDVSDFSVTYSYLFLRRERFELGASLGLHLYNFDGEARVPARFIEEGDARSGPIPAVGLDAAVRFNRRLYAEARAEYMDVEVDEFQVNLINLRAALFYRFNRNIAAGLGYVIYDSHVIVNDPGDSGELQLENRGGELLLRVSF